MNIEKPRLHLDVYKYGGAWHAEIRIGWVGWTDNMTRIKHSHADALDWGLRVMRRLAE